MSIRRDAAVNVAGAILPIGLALVTVPAYLRVIGEARYGVLALAWIFLGYFGLFDLGLGRATAQRIASRASTSAPEVGRIFWTATVVNAGLGLVGAMVLWPAMAILFRDTLAGGAGLRGELRAALPWFSLALPVATVTGVLTGALEGRSRFLALNATSVLGSALTQVIPLLVASWLGPSLAVVVPSVLLTRIAVAALLFERCRTHVLGGESFSFSRTEAGILLRFGGWVTVTSVIGPLMVSLDRFSIGAVLGPAAVTAYSIPFQFASRLTIIPAAVTAALFPRFASETDSGATAIGERSVRVVTAVMTPIAVTAVLLAGPFLDLWLGTRMYEESGPVARLLLAGFWVNGIARIPFAQLQARGRPGLVAKAHAAELLPYLALLFVLLRVVGVVGAAIAFSIRTVLDLVILGWAVGWRWTGARLLAGQAGLVLLSLCVSGLRWSARWHAWLAGAVVVGLSCGVALAIAPSDLRGHLLARIRIGRRHFI